MFINHWQSVTQTVQSIFFADRWFPQTLWRTSFADTSSIRRLCITLFWCKCSYKLSCRKGHFSAPAVPVPLLMTSLKCISHSAKHKQHWKMKILPHWGTKTPQLVWMKLCMVDFLESRQNKYNISCHFLKTSLHYCLLYTLLFKIWLDQIYRIVRRLL